jgi:HEAT repeat protein
VQSATDSDADVRRLAVAIAADVGTREVLPAILAGASDDDPEVRAVAFAGLTRHPDSFGSTPASQALSHADATARARAVDALMACASDPDSVEALIRPLLADDGSWCARSSRCWPRSAAPGVKGNRLNVDDDSLAEPAPRAAVAALGDLGERADLVEQAVSDSDTEVRKAALQGLAGAGPTDTRP